MKSILENLNRSIGVIGSAVMTPDGMMAAAAISDAQDQDALAAIGSSLVLSAARSLKMMGGTALDSLLVEGSLDSAMLDVRGAVERIQRKINLDR